MAAKRTTYLRKANGQLNGSIGVGISPPKIPAAPASRKVTAGNKPNPADATAQFADWKSKHDQAENATRVIDGPVYLGDMDPITAQAYAKWIARENVTPKPNEYVGFAIEGMTWFNLNADGRDDDGYDADSLDADGFTPDGYNKLTGELRSPPEIEEGTNTKDSARLEVLARHPSGDVRAAVAANPHTSIKTLTALAMTENRGQGGEAMWALAARGDADPVLLDTIAHGPTSLYRVRIAKNLATAPGTLLYLAKDGKGKDVEMAVLGNPNVPTNALRSIFDGGGSEPSTLAHSMLRGRLEAAARKKTLAPNKRAAAQTQIEAARP